MTDMIPCITARKGPVDRDYLATFNGVRVKVWAASPAQARQRATEHFKPKKRQTYLLTVELVG